MAKPCHFVGSNATMHAPGFTHPHLSTLKHGGNQYVTRWQMSWKERLSALFFGRIWVNVEGVLGQPPLRVEVSDDFTVQTDTPKQ